MYTCVSFNKSINMNWPYSGINIYKYNIDKEYLMISWHMSFEFNKAVSIGLHVKETLYIFTMNVLITESTISILCKSIMYHMCYPLVYTTIKNTNVFMFEIFNLKSSEWNPFFTENKINLHFILFYWILILRGLIE